MPKKKRQAWRKERAAAMQLSRTEQRTKLVENDPLTVSPESIVSNNEKRRNTRNDNLPLTVNEMDGQRTKKDLQTLHLAPRVYRKDEHATKKDSGNRIVHWDSLENLICCNTKCARCGCEVCLKESTIGIATSIRLTCTNKRCSLNESNKLKMTKFRKHNNRQDSNESFAINIQLILSLLQMGGGSTEAGVLLAFLDLPNSNTFHTKTFTRIMDSIRPEIVKLVDLCMKEGREEEVRTTIGEELYQKYKKGELKPAEVKLVVMYDMGWNKRSSGNKYDSISGHGFLLGGNTRKVINYRCMSKYCRKCFLAERTKKKVDHECPKNHIGSSKSMECEAIFRMVKDAFFNHGYTCGVIVSDDDSTMKSNLKHSYREKIEEGLMSKDDWPKNKQNRPKPDNGRLPVEIPEPHFLADFNHRVKTVGKAVYALASLPQKESQITKDIAARMKLYWGSMLKQIRYLHWEENKEEIKRKVLAPVEHLFNDHQYCDPKWCYVLQAQNENKPYMPGENKPLFDKTKDTKMYDQLKSSVARFQTEKNVTECLHKYDTQSNEGLNMSVSRYVPKFKHYGTSMSLDTRVRCVIGTNNMGYTTYYKTLLTNLGCLEERDDESSNLSSGITRIGKTKSSNKIHKQKQEVKRRRKHSMQARTRQQVLEERTDRAENMGTYRAGIAILGTDNTQQSSNSKKNNTKICSSCGGTGHKTWRTKSCPNHHEYLATKSKKNIRTNKKEVSPTSCRK